MYESQAFKTLNSEVPSDHEGFPGFRKAWAFLQKTSAVDHRKQRLVSETKKTRTTETTETTETKHVNE